MRKTFDLIPALPYIQLTEREVVALRRASELLREMRTLAGHQDDTADSDLGRADANLWGLIRDIDHGRFLL